MKIEDIVKIILISTYKNLSEIAYEDDTEEIDCITKKDVSFFKEFINYVIAIILAFIGYFAIRAFFVWNFGEGMVYPNNNFAISTIMLGLLFPMWSIYGDFFNFWPLPPLDLFSSEKPLEDTSASLKT